MEIKVQKEFNFLSSVHFENQFMLNFYEMTAYMTIYTEETKEQHIAIERLMYFINAFLENTIFIHEKETEAIEKYKAAGIKICPIPEEPYDQIIGLVLINKFNAIMEGRIVVDEIVFGSRLSNLIKFSIYGDEAKLEYEGKHWWNDSGLTTETTKKSKKDKIVKLSDYKDEWKELELTW
jgi:hypothetical protein